MGEVHDLLIAHGKTAVLGMHKDRGVVEAAANFLSSEETDVGYLYSGWAQSALPHCKRPDGESWQIHTDHVSLIVQPGMKSSTTGPAIPMGVPFGSRARLICLYLQSEALRTNSREVELGRSLHGWLRKLEIPIGGKSMAAVRDQADRIARCRMTFEVKSGGRVGLVNQNILDNSVFLADDSDQGSLFIETAKLSESFFEQLKRHPVPVVDQAIKGISNNSMALDIYCWLAYRLHSLTGATPITYKALQAQFGQGIGKPHHFKWYFRKQLEVALAVYPDAKVEIGDTGITLSPARPPVNPKVSPLPRRRLISKVQESFLEG